VLSRNFYVQILQPKNIKLLIKTVIVIKSILILQKSRFGFVKYVKGELGKVVVKGTRLGHTIIKVGVKVLRSK
jgi:hypothetical protein